MWLQFITLQLSMEVKFRFSHFEALDNNHEAYFLFTTSFLKPIIYSDSVHVYIHAAQIFKACKMLKYALKNIIGVNLKCELVVYI